MTSCGGWVESWIKFGVLLGSGGWTWGSLHWALQNFLISAPPSRHSLPLILSTDSCEINLCEAWHLWHDTEGKMLNDSSLRTGKYSDIQASLFETIPFHSAESASNSLAYSSGCKGLNVCVSPPSPNSYVEILTPVEWDGVWRWGLWVVIKLCGWSPHECG